MKAQNKKRNITNRKRSLLIELSESNLNKVQFAAKELQKSESFIIDSILEKFDIIPIKGYRKNY